MLPGILEDHVSRPRILEDHDVTRELLEEQDVSKEIFEEQEERNHADPTTTLAWVGLWQALTGLNPTHNYIYQLWPSGTYVINCFY